MNSPTSRLSAIAPHDGDHSFLTNIASTPDGDIDLGESALVLAGMDQPRTTSPTASIYDPIQKRLQHCRDHLTELAQSIAMTGSNAANASARLSALRAVIDTQEGYRGDALIHETPEHSNLINTIERRKGDGVALGILYIHSARTQGWTAYGLGFPDHFLIALDGGTERIIFDPFYGQIIETAHELRALLKGLHGNGAELLPEYYAPLENRQILLRIQNDLRLSHAASGHLDKAILMSERILLMAPQTWDLYEDLGFYYAETGDFDAALLALDTYLDHVEDPASHQKAVMVAEKIRSREDFTTLN